jgi:DNA invertase Pin-like site-specific DNA recombinase
MTRYVALYCRLSPRPDGSYEGVDAQERWGRDYAASAWLDLPIEVFADPGISAANGDHRPEFERLREWVAAGRIAHIWAVEQSRLERREAEWFMLAAELDTAGIGHLHTNRDGIVRVRDEVAGIKAVLNAGEVRKLKKRVNDALAAKAAAGRPPGALPFGYKRAKDAEGGKTFLIVPEQAIEVRQAADRVLMGWSLASIARDMRERGIRGARGGEITRNAVGSMLTSPAIAAQRVHHGRIAGPGNWDPILDEETWRAVRLKLSQPRRVARSDGGTYNVTPAGLASHAGRRYLLTGGLAVCGVCSAPLVGMMRHRQPDPGKPKAPPKPYLSCHPNRGGRSCVGIMLDPVEKHVVDRLFAELDRPGYLDALTADEHGKRRDEITTVLQAIERQRDELAALWATPGGLTMTEWQTARNGLDVNEQRLRRELAEIPPPLMDVDIAMARETWPDTTLDEQREFLRIFIERVTISKGVKGRKTFDPSRIAIDWWGR